MPLHRAHARSPRFSGRFVVVATAALASLGLSSTSSAAPPARLGAATTGTWPAGFPFVGRPVSSKVRGGLPLWYVTRPSADGSGRIVRGEPTAPVSIRFVSHPTPRDVADLKALGVEVPMRLEATPAGSNLFLAARVPAAAVEGVAALPRVDRITLDGSPFAPAPPLDTTGPEIQAPDAWRTAAPDGNPLTGTGITVCDVDSGIDVFHPLFFRADAGLYAWIDVDGDGKLTPGVDGVDADGDGAPEPLGVVNALVTSFWSDSPELGSGSPDFQAGMDWLYADTNHSGARDFGRSGGFDDSAPGFGEPLFAADDVNGNGKLDVGEKLFRLGSSKIRAVKLGNKVYRRGEGLVDVPLDQSFDHGTSAAGVIAGGNRGVNREVGIAPDAELIMAKDVKGGYELYMTQFCIQEGARVVLHEYAPWVGYHLDGSSDLEKLIDSSVKKGVSHVNPAGNLSTSKKLYKHVLPAGEESVIQVEAPKDSPYGPFHVFAASILWRDVSRDLAITLEDPTGFSAPASTGSAEAADWHGGLSFYSGRDDSDRGTARVDLYVFASGSQSVAIPGGTWKVHVTDPKAPGSPGIEVIGYVEDDVSGWGKGIHFPEDSSEDHLIGYPGTADHGLAVAAYTGHGFQGGTPGTRAYYSGRGHRIDGESILSVSGPDDPVTAGYRDGSPARYFIFGGTSGASPHVAGAAALLLQADPARTGDDVRAAIRAGALDDGVVGVIPNDDYGYGKLRVYKSLFGKDPPVSAPPTLTVPPVELAVGKAGDVAIEAADPDEGSQSLVIELDRDYDGIYEERLEKPSFQASFADKGTYFSKVRVTDSTGKQATALASISVVDAIVKDDTPPKADVASELYSPAGGGGCTASGPSRDDHGGSWIGWASLAALALVSRRRAGRAA